MLYGNRFTLTVSWCLGLLGGAFLWGQPSIVKAEDPSTSATVQAVAMTSQSPGWAERLKGQTIVENAMEGRAERAALVERQHQRLMEQMQKGYCQLNENPTLKRQFAWT